MAIEVYNTLTRTREAFVPRDPGRVSIYVCGPTPYDYAHLGHLRPAVIWQVIRNYLEYRGFKVTLVQNFTDIDDKILDRARKMGTSAREVAETFIHDYLEAMDRLGLDFVDRYPRVTRHIPQVVEMIARLVENGTAYAAGGSVYFDVSRFPEYGKLSGQRAEALEAGARIEVDERKRNPADFALWKAARPGEVSWPAPWGPGRPGWHIECSAMSIHYLGFGFDFHGGGHDLVFPHHENEVAQAEAYEGRPGFVRYWLHNGLVSVKSEKMSKSLGNYTTAREVLAGEPASLVKFFLLSTQYRSPVEFTPSSFAEARPGWERLAQAFRRFAPYGRYLVGLGREAPDQWLDDRLEAGFTHEDEVVVRALAAVRGVRKAFEEAMDDDFNTPRAVAAIFDLVRDTNPLVERTSAGTASVEAPPAPALILATAYALMRRYAQEILEVVDAPPAASAAPGPPGAAGGLGSGRRPLVDALVDLVVELREGARKRRAFEEADMMRRRLNELGVAVEDTPLGPRVSIRSDGGAAGAGGSW